MDEMNNNFGYKVDPSYMLDEMRSISRRVDRLTDIACILFGLIAGIVIYIILT